MRYVLGDLVGVVGWPHGGWHPVRRERHGACSDRRPRTRATSGVLRTGPNGPTRPRSDIFADIELTHLLETPTVR